MLEGSLSLEACQNHGVLKGLEIGLGSEHGNLVKNLKCITWLVELEWSVKHTSKCLTTVNLTKVTQEWMGCKSYLRMMDGWPRDASRRELGQVTPVLLPKTAKVPGAGALHRQCTMKDCNWLVTWFYEIDLQLKSGQTCMYPDMHPPVMHHVQSCTLSNHAPSNHAPFPIMHPWWHGDVMMMSQEQNQMGTHTCKYSTNLGTHTMWVLSHSCYYFVTPLLLEGTTSCSMMLAVSLCQKSKMFNSGVQTWE